MCKTPGVSRLPRWPMLHMCRCKTGSRPLAHLIMWPVPGPAALAAWTDDSQPLVQLMQAAAPGTAAFSQEVTASAIN